MHQAAIALNQQMFPVFLGLLLAAAIAWLFLSNRLYKTLEQSFPELYESLGSPRLFMNKRGAANIGLVRFLFRRDYGTIKDPALIRLCQGLRYIFIIYVICLGGCLLLLLENVVRG
jgi:hypothetical protein